MIYSRLSSAAGADRRIGDNLATVARLLREQAARLSSRCSPVERDEVEAILAELGGRVDAVARLHQLLAENPAESALNLGVYLRDISAAIVAALSSDRDVRLRFDCDPHCFALPERALPIGFIVVELVTNAVKYAHPTGVMGEIKVACTQAANGTITIEVADDGVGLPEGLDPRTVDSLGLPLVRSVADQLSAKVQFADSALGFSCVLQIPGELRA
jgi:two-component sensor histidine kinase